MSQMWLLCVWGISWTKSAYCYSDTFSSHHPCCRYTNHLCTTHVINLVDPGAARFLASQMKLLRRYSHKLPHIWKSSKCNNLFSSSNSSQFKISSKKPNRANNLIYGTTFSRAFSLLQFTISGEGIYEGQVKKVCVLYT